MGSLSNVETTIYHFNKYTDENLDVNTYQNPTEYMLCEFIFQNQNLRLD